MAYPRGSGLFAKACRLFDLSATHNELGGKKAAFHDASIGQGRITFAFPQEGDTQYPTHPITRRCTRIPRRSRANVATAHHRP